MLSNNKKKGSFLSLFDFFPLYHYQEQGVSPQDAELEELKSSIQEMDVTTGKIIKLCRTLDQASYGPCLF